MQTLKLALHGVAGRDAQLLQTYLDLIESRGKHLFQFVDDDSAQIVIVDMENAPAVPPQGGDSILIAYSPRPDAVAGFAHHLPKPIRFRDIQQLVDELASGATPTPRAPEPVVTKSSQSRAPTAAATKADTLYHQFARSQLTESLEVQAGPHVLLLDVAAGVAFISHPLEAQALLFTTATDQMTLRTPSETTLNTARDSMAEVSIEQIKWISACLGAGGALPGHAEMNDRFRLRRWPNLKALYSRPYFNKLAGIMSRRSATVEEIAHTTDIGVSDVANFVCACALCGYVSREAGTTEIPTHHPESTNAASGIFRRIRLSLGLG